MAAAPGRFPYPLLIGLLAAATLAAIVAAATAGHVEIGPGEVARILLARLQGLAVPDTGSAPLHGFVVLDVRLPRVLAALLVGAGLGLAGVVFQGILLNPLADPYTLGISSGAAFGASLALLLGLAGTVVPVPLFAFAGALLTLLVVLRLATVGGQLGRESLILSGVIVGAILAAGVSFMKYLADEQVSVIIFWLMGSFASRSWQHIALLAVALLVVLPVVLYHGRDLNVLALGNRDAAALGVETGTVRRRLLVAASLLAAVCVSVSGIIGFIGLIVPHLMRFLVGPDNRRLLTAAALGGGLLLLAADTASRTLLPNEIPVGVLTALLGGPFFCMLFRKRYGGRHG